jgi:hypothetical protein
MYKDGLYLSHGSEKHALVIVREENGSTLWLRDFVTVEAALDILEDEVLSEHSRGEILSNLSGRRGFFTENVVKPEGGFSDYAFLRYVLSPNS